MARTIFLHTNEDFGYYIYSPELFGYSPRYAMEYVQKEFRHKAIPFEKKPTTYLIMIPSLHNGVAEDMTWWKTEEVRIATSAASVHKIGSYVVEKYILSPEDIAVMSNPLLIQDIHFR
ncbi:MAG: hypothetical protein UZ22_OP11002000945 [Microgenomates bacterium OLB23]|nr:MAG: hypothetical protein UZ22_OP11002000945 [Microgenomates bacterium OLB23]